MAQKSIHLSQPSQVLLVNSLLVKQGSFVPAATIPGQPTSLASCAVAQAPEAASLKQVLLMKTNTLCKGKMCSHSIWEKSGRRNKSIIHHGAFSNPGHVPNVLPLLTCTCLLRGQVLHPPTTPAVCTHTHWYPKAPLESGPWCSDPAKTTQGERVIWLKRSWAPSTCPPSP